MQKKKKKAHIDAFTGDRVLFYIWVLHNAFTTIYELFSLKLIIILITWVILAPHVLSAWFYVIILNVPIGILLGFSSGITGCSLNFDTKSWKNPKVSCHVISCFCIWLCVEHDYQISGSNSPGVSRYCIENPWEYNVILPVISSCNAKCEPSVGWWTFCVSCSTAWISPIDLWSVWLSFSFFQIVLHYYIETYWHVAPLRCVCTYECNVMSLVKTPG